MSWCTIESDPAVFTELMRAWGVSSALKMQEVYALEALPPNTRALFFLFKWEEGKGVSRPDAAHTTGSSPDAPLFFKQVVSNACGSLALLHALLNVEGIEAGPTLTDFKAFCAGLDPHLRGELLEQCDAIRIAHNSFARPEAIEVEQRRATADDDVFHFVAYIPYGGAVWECDGLKPAPVRIGDEVPGLEWSAVAVPEVARRTAEYAESEVRFNLVALVDCPLAGALATARKAAARLRALSALALSLGAPAAAGDEQHGGDADAAVAAATAAAAPFLTEASLAAAPGEEEAEEAAAAAAIEGAADVASALAVAASAARLELDEALATAAAETAERQGWRAENERRRHNFVPLIMAALRGLAARGKLQPALEAAVVKAREARARAYARKAGAVAAAATSAGTAPVKQA